MDTRLSEHCLNLLYCDDFLQVTNFGPSPVNKMELEFKIPISYAGVEHFIQIYDIKVRIFSYVCTGSGPAISQWLRCCATNRKVAGSILALGSTQHLKEVSARSISWG